jgi:putative redox protein
MKTKTNWIKKFQLEGETQTGHSVKMDSAASGAEVTGPTPKELFLQSLAGCTMMDVALIVEKSRKQLDKFWVEVDGELCDTHPKTFKKIRLKYNFVSPDLDEDTAKKAIDISREKYCSIYNTIKNCVEITYSFEISKTYHESENQINHKEDITCLT